METGTVSPSEVQESDIEQLYLKACMLVHKLEKKIRREESAFEHFGGDSNYLKKLWRKLDVARAEQADYKNMLTESISEAQVKIAI